MTQISLDKFHTTTSVQQASFDNLLARMDADKYLLSVAYAQSNSAGVLARVDVDKYLVTVAYQYQPPLFSIVGDQLNVASDLSAEVGDHPIQVRVTDAEGRQFTKTITITVTT